MNDFVQWAKEQKKEKNLSYREIAKMVGCSHTHVFYSLTEKRPLTMDMVALLSVALGNHGELDIVGSLRMADLLPVQLPPQLPMKNQSREE